MGRLGLILWYNQLMQKVASLILENPKGEILLYLRDNNPAIPFPHHWDLFGGHVEEGESPEEALKRELQEELGLDVKNHTFFKEYVVTTEDLKPNRKFVYVAPIAMDGDQITLHEGERTQFFSPKEISTLKLASIHKQILTDYLRSKTN